MPSKYYSVYNYAFNVLDLIKSKIPKCKFENKHGKFMLMKNLPFPNFEAEFKCGTKLLHQVSSDKLILRTPDGHNEVGLTNGDLDRLEPRLKQLVAMSLRILEVCLKQE